MFQKSLLFLIISLLSFSICTTWDSPETLFHSSRITEIEGDYAICRGIAISPATGDLYFSDQYFERIFRISNGEVHLVAGAGVPGFKDGPFLTAQFDSLGGMVFGPNGSFLLVADLANNVIRMLDFEKGSVSTIAGTPKQPGISDGIKAKFDGPNDITIDSTGKIAFVADFFNHRVRKIDLTNGNVTTVAGTGQYSFNGNEGPAIKINLYLPTAIMYQESKNILLISDNLCALRMVNGTGYLTTILRDCNIIPYPWGIVEKDNTTVLVSDIFRNVIVSINIYTSSSSTFAGGLSGGFFDGSRLEATFSSPTYLAKDPFGKENFYISDYRNSAIRKISKADYVSTELKTTGSGSEDGYMGLAKFNSPTYLALDESDNILYVSDTSNHAIRRIYLKDNFKVDALTGKPYGGYVDGGFGVALFSFPRSLLLDHQDDKILYVCDSGNRVIRAIYLNQDLVNTTKQLSSHYSTIILKGGIVFEVPRKSYLGSTESVESATWLNNETLIMSIGELHAIWIGEWKNENVYSSVLTGIPSEFGYKDGDAKSAKFEFPLGIALFKETLFIADSHNNVIRTLDMNRSLVSTYYGSGRNGYRNGPSFASEFKLAVDIKMDKNGTIYIADEKAHAIRMIKDGALETIAGFGAKVSRYDVDEFTFGFECLVKLMDNQFLISDKRNSVIFVLNLNGTVYNIKPMIGSGMIGLKDDIGLNSMLKEPTDLALSSSNSILYIADSGNHAIRAYDLKSGYLRTCFTSLTIKPSPKIILQNPRGIALDTIENKLFISDTNNHGIKVLDLESNTLSLLSGSRTSSPGFKNSWFGDFASFANPIGIVVSMKEKVIYVCDSYNHAIRKVLYNGTVTTIANLDGIPGYLDGNISYSKMLYPTKLALTSSRNTIFILDSGNNRIRSLDLQSQMMSTVLETQEWPMNSIHLVSFDNLYANNRRTIKMFKSIPLTTTSAAANGGFNVIITAIIVSLSILIFSFATFYFFSSRRKFKNVVQKINLVGQRDLNDTPESTATLNISRTVAVSLPGHLCIHRSLNQISLESSDLKSGGTAKVIKGKLKDQEMISKTGIVDVAIKIANHNETDKQVVLESFRYEVALMAALPESPYLIKLIGYCLDPMVIVMKYYGMNLQECLDSKKYFTSTNIKMKAMMDIAKGMNLVHNKDIIHFDLKPGNILLELNFQSVSNFVICDFGFADFTDEAGRQFVAGMKKPSLKGITIRYAAPELFSRSFDSVNPAELKKVDVYAFAMIAYYIWFDLKPFEGENSDGIQAKVLKFERPDLPENTDDRMKHLIQKYWHQDPKQRPTFKEIIADLNSFNLPVE